MRKDRGGVAGKTLRVTRQVADLVYRLTQSGLSVTAYKKTDQTESRYVVVTFHGARWKIRVSRHEMSRKERNRNKSIWGSRFFNVRTTEETNEMIAAISATVTKRKAQTAYKGGAK